MSVSSRMPLHVYQVLEEEYRRLHGELSRDELVELHGRSGILARLDWQFHAGHIKDALQLAERLGRGDDISRHLHTVLPSLEGHLRDYQNSKRSSHLEDALNELLAVEIYDKAAFKGVELKKATVKLAEVYGESSDKSADALANLNRLLLEETFPDELETLADIRLAAMYRRLHNLPGGQTALCFSGGGIRSGTFSLGVLQGLARRNLLEKFDYLSTVSGGGYIGSWLTAWLHRHPEGLAGVTRDLKNTAPATQIDPDPKPIQYLRQYSNFITPKVGILTADTWTFIGIYFRNLLLNWLVFVPLLLAVLMLPRVLLTFTLWQPVEPPEAITTVRIGDREVPADQVDKLKLVPTPERVKYPPKPVRWIGENFFNLPLIRIWFADDMNLYARHLLFLLGLICGVWALGYIAFNRPGLRGLLGKNRQFWYRRSTQKGFLRYCLVPLLFSSFFLTTYWAWSQETATTSKSPWRFILFGLVFTVCGGIIASIVLRRRFFGRVAPGEPDERVRWSEIGAIVGAGIVGGLLFWVVSLFELGEAPVIAYGQVIRDGMLMRSPLPWTDWTKLMWSSWTTELYVCFAVPIFLLIFWAATTFFVGVSSVIPRIGDEDREWWARFGAWLLIAAGAWSILSVLVIFGPYVLLELPRLIVGVGGISGLIAILVGRSAMTPARHKAEDEKQQSSAAGILSKLVGGSLPLFGAIFLAAFIALISLLATGITRKLVVLADDYRQSQRTAQGPQQQRQPSFEWLTNVPEEPPRRGFDDYRRFIEPVVPTLVKPTPTPLPGATPCTPLCPAPGTSGDDDERETADSYIGAQIVHMNILHHTSLGFTALLAVLFFIIGLLLSRAINLNYFSIHGGYRNRLIRAFLGASRPPGQRKPNPFTGFDPADNIPMHEMRHALFDEDDLILPEQLASQLLDEEHPLSRHLLNKKLLDPVKNLAARNESPELRAALRTSLNDVIEQETLYLEDFAAPYMKHAEKILETIRGEMARKRTGEKEATRPRVDYHLLMNRIVLEGAYPGTINPYPPPPYKLMHVINTTLNLVGGDNLAWQQRKAEPFSVTPLHSGCFRLGYRDSRDYGGKDTGGISIGTAAAISGAAASSNMGYYTTSPVISLLLTLFNVRLGWWLGNPGAAGVDTYERSAPKYAALPVVHEAFGLTDDRNKYVYLTDGGHFENLAVYEMVLRRCRVIVAVDGGQDEQYGFGDLGSAVRKIRIDLGISIDFPCVDIYSYEQMIKEKDNKPGMYWAVGRIRYSCVDGRSAPDGVMLYIKPALYGNEPRDVLEYKKSFPAFPHQSTGDQFFDEPQFESYRELASHIMDQLCGTRSDSLNPKTDDMELDEMLARAAARLRDRCEESLKGDEGHAVLRGRDGRTFLEWLRELAGQPAPEAARSGPASDASRDAPPSPEGGAPPQAC